jgi:hypothetical protein
MSDPFSDHRRTRRRFGCTCSESAACTEAEDTLGIATSAVALKSLDGLREQAVTLPGQFQVGHFVGSVGPRTALRSQHGGSLFRGLEEFGRGADPRRSTEFSESTRCRREIASLQEPFQFWQRRNTRGFGVGVGADAVDEHAAQAGEVRAAHIRGVRVTDEERILG